MTSAGRESVDEFRLSRSSQSTKFRATDPRDAPLVKFSDIAHILQTGEGPVQEAGLAQVALNLATWSLRQTPRPEQHRRVHSHIVLFRYRSPDGAHHRPDIQQQPRIRVRRPIAIVAIRRSVAALDFGCDDQLFFVGDIDRKRRATARSYCGMTLFHRQFDVVGVKVAPADNDQILQTTGDKQFAIFEKSQISGAQKWPLTAVREVGPQVALRLLGAVPITPANGRAGDPDFAYRFRCATSQRFRMNDDNPGIGRGGGTANEGPHILLLAGDLREAVLFKSRRLNRIEARLTFQSAAGHHEGGFGESVAGIQEAWTETISCKGRSKPFQSVRTDWLGAIIGCVPAAEIEIFAPLRSNFAGAQLVGEIGTSTDGAVVSRNCPEPPHRPLKKGLGRQKKTWTSYIHRLDDSISKSHIMKDR